MKIRWYGHACFLLTASGGTKILTDPFDKSVGYPIPDVEADIVTVSHDHHDHNNVKMVKGSRKIINTPGAFIEHGIKITGTPTYHDRENGKKRGANIVFSFIIDGLKVCHMGDLGHVPYGEQLDEIGKPDVLLIPVGGTYTIDYNDAVRTIELVNPGVVIPMHYKTPALSFALDSLDKFADKIGKVSYSGKQEIEISKESLNSLDKVIALDFNND